MSDSMNNRRTTIKSIRAKVRNGREEFLRAMPMTRKAFLLAERGDYNGAKAIVGQPSVYSNGEIFRRNKGTYRQHLNLNIRDYNRIAETKLEYV